MPSMTGISQRKGVSTGKLITPLKLSTTITEIHCTIAFTPERNNKKWQRYVIRRTENMADMGTRHLAAHHPAH
jgi:hypothetical protein